ncbi:MAG TPA: GspE/PulE family protein [Bacteroidota bacterium]|jgi:type IV pilus assembly protein PilB|nr:GspE/PulE family protein [Bacteroidota bacterium]
MIEEIKNIPSKVAIEQFDVSTLAKDKIRELFRTGKLPTAEAMVDEILLRAAKEGATDLHVEPADNEVRIRIGREGVMKRLVHLPKEISENLASVLKTRANLNAFEKKKPQEGRFSTTIGNQPIDIRISTVPIMMGERVALRLLFKNTTVANMEELGFSANNLEKFRSLLKRSSGLVLVTGPSSSGKSTTIYAAVKSIQSPEKNIFTVENPIEYKLDLASQVSTGIDKSFTFVDALRAILRQNPDVIMLGEIRDAETGIVASEAALTGNLVLSTLIATDAVGAIPRMLNIGVPAYWLASTLVGVVHQALVRKICEACKEQYIPQEGEGATLLKMLTEQKLFFRGKGCAKCGGSGYNGRTAIQEVLVVNDQLRDLIYQQASILKLKEAARLSGFVDIFEDAKTKVAAGVTTIQEFERALG